MTVTQFRKRAEAALRRANPDTEITTKWVYGPKHVTTPTGVKVIVGQFMASGPGYRTRRIMADYDKQTKELMVR